MQRRHYLWLFLLQIINSKKLSANASWLSPSDDKEYQRCGFESCYKKCPPGSCCSWLGFCGTGKKYCGREHCKTQCPFQPSGRPLPLYVPGQCGVQAGGRKCPTGLCCSEDGWCGATEYHCNPQRCQSQCRNLTSSAHENRYGGEPECGRQGCYKMHMGLLWNYKRVLWHRSVSNTMSTPTSTSRRIFTMRI